jgi:hypothetical protein
VGRRPKRNPKIKRKELIFTPKCSAQQIIIKGYIQLAPTYPQLNARPVVNDYGLKEAITPKISCTAF